MEVFVDLAVGLELYRADGEQFGPAPVDPLSFKVSVNNAAEQYDPCRAEPEACDTIVRDSLPLCRHRLFV